MVDREPDKFGTPDCASSGWDLAARFGGLAKLSVKGAAEEPEEPNDVEKVLFNGECWRRGDDMSGKTRKRRDRRGKRDLPPPSPGILAEGVLNIAERFRKLAPLTGIRIGSARFDTEGQAKPGDPWD
jgi:hypothetical protein